MKVNNYSEKIQMPEGASVTVTGRNVTVKGEKGVVTKTFIAPQIKMSASSEGLQFDIVKYTKREKTLLGTYKSHVKNMLKGVTEGHEYKMKICSGHFPMNVSFANNQLSVKNFLGEKIPRTLDTSPDVEVKVEGDFITISGIDKEKVAQTAASIEQLCRRSSFDKRIFQDGIYIVNKDGKEIK